MKKTWINWLLPFVFIAVSCSKEDTPPVGPSTETKGIYILNEGNFNQNNAKLGFYSFETNTYTGDYFSQQNPGAAGLGDVATDMVLYGSKLYIVVNNSNQVLVLNAATGVLIETISFAGRQPRYALATQGKVFVTAYDGTVSAVDTGSLTLSHSITVGTNPEGIALSGNKLYVANSGGLNWPLYDSTISEIDLTTLTETRKILVGKNPNSIAADDMGNLYVSCIGDYGSIAPKIVKVNAATGSIVHQADTAVGVIRYYNNRLYVTGGFLGANQVRTLSTTDFSVTSANIISDGTSIQMPYGLDIDGVSEDYYITDAKDFVATGTVFCFDANGIQKFNISTSPGVLPNKLVFIR